jgi:hypothetical protein
MKKIALFLIFFFFVLSTGTMGNDFHDLLKHDNLRQIQNEIKRDPRLASMKDELGRTPVHLAAESGNLRLVNILINSGCPVNEKDHLKGYSALHYAVLHNHPKITAFLLSRRADINAISSDKNTPLHLSCANGCVETTKILLEHKALINALNSFYRTPLHMAAAGPANKDRFPYANKTFAEYLQIARMLVQKGARTDIKDFRRDLPAGVAESNWPGSEFVKAFEKLMPRNKPAQQ